MLSKILVITLVFIFGLSMFAAGVLAPDDYRLRARSWMDELMSIFPQSSQDADTTQDTPATGESGGG